MRVRLQQQERERLTAIFNSPSFIHKRERLAPTVCRERLSRELLRIERVRIKESKRLTILEVENGQCRYPVGRTGYGINEHLFCGNDVTLPHKSGKPRVYCDWHHAKAHSQRLPAFQAD